MQRPTPKDEEIILDANRYIVSKTDVHGNITYANDYFLEIVQYSKDELIGKPHSIIRHPDMPRVIFKLMWDEIKKGNNFRAIIKNLAKDGRYYWVLTDFENLYDPASSKILSYTAYRNVVPKKAIEAIVPIYKKLLELEAIGGMDASQEYLDEYLKLNKTTYNDFINSLIEEEKSGGISDIVGSFKNIFKKK